MRFTFPHPLARLLPALLVVAFVFLLSGMGGSGSKIVRNIPEPDRAFTVQIRDVAARTYTVEKFSIEGVTYLPSHLGKAKLGIDFKRIARVDIHEQGDNFTARIRFRDSTRQEVLLDPETTFSGQSKWGPIELGIEDIASLEFATP